jgi:Na+/H+ antiporter NhaA
MADVAASTYSGRTAWARNLASPVRSFLAAESGSAVVLLGATIAALVWVNVHASSYTSLWTTHLEIRIGDASISQDLRHWVNNGLMTFFFFVVGLEARREFDMGELRERKRIALPVLAGIGGMLVPVLIYLAFNASGPGAGGWGTAMSTDTAFALGVLALVGRRSPDRLRVFMLTVAVVDDVLALIVIATAYTSELHAVAFVCALGAFAAMLVARSLGVRSALPYALLGGVAWVAVLESGIDPVIVGLVMGLLTYAYPAARSELEAATRLFRSFREQPTPELARSAQMGLLSTISPNERLQALFHPWTSYMIVPLFALANAGIAIDAGFLRRAATSPITLGILVGYVVGKPLGIVGTTWLAVRLERGRLRAPVTWPPLLGGGAVAGIGFTVSLLIASLAFHGDRLNEAKAGVLAAAVCASVLAWLVFRVTELLPLEWRARQLVRTARSIVDLATPVDDERDHIRGEDDAPVTVVEYGDFQCPFCGQAEAVIRELLSDFGDDLRYVWRHLPLADVHERAQLAAEASEAAAAQGQFWPMHDLLISHQDDLKPSDLFAYAEQLGLDVDRFSDELRRHVYAARVAEDVDSADLSGVSGTPSFFVNGMRHQGAYDLDTLTTTVRNARKRAVAERRVGAEGVVSTRR